MIFFFLFFFIMEIRRIFIFFCELLNLGRIGDVKFIQKSNFIMQQFLIKKKTKRNKITVN